MKTSLLLVALILAAQAPTTSGPAKPAPTAKSIETQTQDDSTPDEQTTTEVSEVAGDTEPVSVSSNSKEPTSSAKASVPATPEVTHSRWPDAVQLFHLNFSEQSDLNFDHWPDRWKRKTGPGYPKYLPIGIREDPTATEKRALKIELDGAAATIHSPPIFVDARFSYVLVAKIKTGGLVHDEAHISVDLFDEDNKRLESFPSTKIKSAEDWTAITIGPFAPKSSEVSHAVIGLHLQPTEKRDLTGWASFDDIWFARLPRMILETNRESNVYTDPTQVRVTCRLSGIVERDPEIRFELLDASRRKIDEEKDRLKGRIIAHKSSKVSDLLGGENKAGYEGTAVWKPELGKDDYGFYRVRVTMHSSSGKLDRKEATVAVVRPPKREIRGEFGWTLPNGENPLSLDVLNELCPHVGINWLKFPVWYGEDEIDRGDQLMRFAERLGAKGIEIVGMLDQPPLAVRTRFAVEGRVSAANIFAGDRELWFDSLDPVMTRLSLKIRWWQLGNDHDTSFVGYPHLQEKIQDIRRHLYRFGQDVQFGFGWKWLEETLADVEPPWEFLTHSTDPTVSPLTGHELATYLKRSEKPGPLRWVVVEPLRRGKYQMEVRARDLVEQMIFAKIHDADAIFVANPFDSLDKKKKQTGLMNDDGTPGELLLPWRTTALMLSGTDYLGSIRMPGGSTNHIFTRGGETVMIVWNESEKEEVLFLGNEVEQIDIWGRSDIPEQKEHRQVIRVGPLPTFITGVSKPVAQWRMATRFNHERMPSVFGKTHRNGVVVKNYFQQGVSSDMWLDMPPSWRFDSKQKRTLKLAVGEQYSKPIEFRLPIDATSGRQVVQIDFDVTVDRRYQFSVYRDLEVGLGDVTIDAVTHLDEDGVLVVEQVITNKSDRIIDFKCYLSAEGERRKRNQVFRLSRGQDKKYYYYPDGKDLVGKWLWLRAEEIGGQRILNVKFQAQE